MSDTTPNPAPQVDDFGRNYDHAWEAPDWFEPEADRGGECAEL